MQLAINSKFIVLMQIHAILLSIIEWRSPRYFNGWRNYSRVICQPSKMHKRNLHFIRPCSHHTLFKYLWKKLLSNDFALCECVFQMESQMRTLKMEYSFQWNFNQKSQLLQIFAHNIGNTVVNNVSSMSVSIFIV